MRISEIAALVDRNGSYLSVFVQPDTPAISSYKKPVPVFPEGAHTDARDPQQGIQPVIGDSKAQQAFTGGYRDKTGSDLFHGEGDIAVDIGLRIPVLIGNAIPPDHADADGIGHEHRIV